jgi:hypothetical protein
MATGARFSAPFGIARRGRELPPADDGASLRRRQRDRRPGTLVFHVTSLLLHAANAVLVGWLLSALGARRDAAWAGALLWAVHPLRVESVAWISGRKDVLSTFFFLSACLFYLRDARAEGASRRSYAYALFSFACALLSKATAVALVPVLFLFDGFIGRPVTRKTLLEKLPFVALALGAGWMAIRAQATAGALPVGRTPNLPARIAIACYGLAFYVVKTVAPWGLSALYPYPSPPGTLPKGAVVAVLAVAVGAVRPDLAGAQGAIPRLRRGVLRRDRGARAAAVSGRRRRRRGPLRVSPRRRLFGRDCVRDRPRAASTRPGRADPRRRDRACGRDLGSLWGVARRDGLSGTT